jgi:phosphoglycerate dehydrogenase-like enzyme
VRLLHLAQNSINDSLFRSPFLAQLESFGTLEIVENAGPLSENERAKRARACDVLLTGWGSASVPEELAENSGDLRYVCHLTGGMRGIVPLALVESKIPVTNWGDAPANRVAEGAVALLLACLKNLHDQTQTKRDGGWVPQSRPWSGTLRGLRLGAYGYGAIGRRFCELVQPFGPKLLVFDPYVNDCPFPTVASLDELFAGSDAVAIHAGLSPETMGSVTARFLASLPDHGVLINTARGGIVDQDALFAELESGRLRAGLDVLAGDDRLPPEHPARRWPNLILSAHSIEQDEWPPPADGLLELHRVALDNLGRFAKNEPLRFRMTPERYALST